MWSKQQRREISYAWRATRSPLPAGHYHGIVVSSVQGHDYRDRPVIRLTCKVSDGRWLDCRFTADLGFDSRRITETKRFLTAIGITDVKDLPSRDIVPCGTEVVARIREHTTQDGREVNVCERIEVLAEDF